MPSVLDSQLEKYYQQINTLSADAIESAKAEDYEKSEKLLIDRLSLLKELAACIPSENENPSLFSQYQEFLLALQQSDLKELSILNQELSKVAAENSQQLKVTKAVNAYQTIKQAK